MSIEKLDIRGFTRSYYHDCPVIRNDSQKARLTILQLRKEL